MPMELADRKSEVFGDLADFLTPAASAVASLSVTVSVSASFGLPADDQTPFERERATFYHKLPELMTTHAGKYVAISGGQFAGSGDSDSEVASRFFHEHPDADVYIGFVGEEPVARQISPASR